MSNALGRLALVVEEEIAQLVEVEVAGEINLDDEEEDEVDESPIWQQLSEMSVVEVNRTTEAFTNFSFDGLMDLWRIGEEAMISAWSGRGRKSVLTAFDAFYLLLYYYKRRRSAEVMINEFTSIWAPQKLNSTVVPSTPSNHQKKSNHY
jgi:hypothetical protein